MATIPVEVKTATPPAPVLPDGWRALRTEMDHLFDRVASGLGVPSFNGLATGPPALRFGSSWFDGGRGSRKRLPPADNSCCGVLSSVDRHVTQDHTSVALHLWNLRPRRPVVHFYFASGS